ncbi:MAG: nitrate reductase subunit beta [Mangrovibacterium sp.]
MKIQSQIAMVLNLDKCIGCHTCSVTCKNVWTSRKGVEYAWFNNVETKPGTGYPVEWENQKKYNGGWKLDKEKLKLNQGSSLGILSKIFANPDMPSLEDYYEPYTFNFSKLTSNKRFHTPPSARPYSLITGERMEKIEYGPNWEDNLGGEFETRKKDPNLKDVDIEGYDEFEKSFMFYVPRLCEHCLNPACAASCPSGAIYKRKEDGVVLINQDACRGWRECVSACPYKKIYFNWNRKKSEKCTFCYPLLENGKPTVCSESCVGRIRYMGVLLYDADRIDEYAGTKDEAALYEKQLDLILDPHAPEVIAQAEKQGITHEFIKSAQASPVYKMMKQWKVAFPLHPEYRTMPMVWYTPPLSPIVQQVDAQSNFFNTVENMRIPVSYIAKMMTAGDEAPVKEALARLLVMRNYMRERTVEKNDNPNIPENIGLRAEDYEEMYRYLAIADYDNRFVIPTAPTKNEDVDLFALRAGLGFEYPGKENKKRNLFGGK